MNTGEQHGLYEYTPIVERPRFSWPSEARVALWVVPNIEHQVFVQANGGVDVPAFSRGDYANRVGVWRIMETLDRFGIRGTVALNSSVCRHYPQVVRACLERGWAAPWFNNPLKPDWLVCKLTEAGRRLLETL